jgi:23S rRNA pseudouridine1911/1915/1917 synthase
VIGDPVYGRVTRARLDALGSQGREAVNAMHRQALHAYLLGLRHPTSGELLRWEVGLPAELEFLTKTLLTDN